MFKMVYSSNNIIRNVILGATIGTAALAPGFALGQTPAVQAGQETPVTDKDLVDLIKNSSPIFPQSTSNKPGNVYYIDDGKGTLTYRIGSTEKDILIDCEIKKEEKVDGRKKTYGAPQWDKPRVIAYDKNGQMQYISDIDLDSIADKFKGKSTTGDVDLTPTFEDTQVEALQKRFDNSVNQAYRVLKTFINGYVGMPKAAQPKK